MMILTQDWVGELRAFQCETIKGSFTSFAMVSSTYSVRNLMKKCWACCIICSKRVWLLVISTSSYLSAAFGPAKHLRLLGPNGPEAGCGKGWWVFLWCTSRSSWCNECSRTWSCSFLCGGGAGGVEFVDFLSLPMLWHKPMFSWIPGSTCAYTFTIKVQVTLYHFI